MGLFDLFKKKKSEKESVSEPEPNVFLRAELKRRLEDMGHTVLIQNGVVHANNKIGIQVEILEDPNLHPSVTKVGVLITVEDYFGKGLSEILAGIGNTMEQKVNSALQNLLTVTLPPILDAFTDSHDPNLDFSVSGERGEILWHPKLGNLGFQGQWSEYPEYDQLFGLLQGWVKDKMIDRKFNWLKIYLAKQGDGSIMGDCSLNNEFYEDGFKLLEEYANTWDNVDSFRAVKQFILFRRCDACDE